ncbi:hypothetical protein MVEG_00596 [Podila verticillata NRRL 6337]|nr:hypothetical protein MVEG_00596 [Podila verticillata NRRL 6337]
MLWSRYEGESKLDIEIWRLMSDMPGLQELSLANLVVDASALVFFETICARLRVLQLYARRVDISDSIKTSAPWTIQELLISEYCHIDAVAFTARCPDLEVFEFCTKDEPQKCQSFAQYLDSGALPRLKHLDLSVVTRSDEETASFIMGMRCLRKFKMRFIFKTHMVGCLNSGKNHVVLSALDTGQVVQDLSQ